MEGEMTGIRSGLQDEEDWLKWLGIPLPREYFNTEGRFPCKVNKRLMRLWPGIQKKHWSLLVCLLRGVELACREDSEAALEKDCVVRSQTLLAAIAQSTSLQEGTLETHSLVPAYLTTFLGDVYKELLRETKKYLNITD